MRDINISQCKWHMRICDVENNERFFFGEDIYVLNIMVPIIHRR